MSNMQLIPGEIGTYTGKLINVFQPDPELICIEDIAHALSQQCRFSGHTARFYSVAEHSVYCAAMVSGKHKLAALLHDASEAYLVDLPSPIKMAMPEYVDIEDRLMKVIAEKFGFQYPLHMEVKKADKAWLNHEWKGLMAREFNMLTLWPENAERIFLRRFNEITKSL